MVVDLDATLIGAHSEKEGATPNFKRGFGVHPMLAFVDHGAGGTGEPLAGMLRPGRPTPTTPPTRSRYSMLRWPSCPNRHGPGAGARRHRVGSEGVPLAHPTPGLALLGRYLCRQPVLDALAALPAQAWRAALDADGRPREGAQVAELTRWLPATFTGWPPGMRVIARRERPIPAPNCASPTTRAGGSPCSPPTPSAGGRPTWNSATGCGPAPRTASAGSRTPG